MEEIKQPDEALITKLKQRMALGVVQFVYIKGKGEKRVAFGTVRPDIVIGTFSQKASKERLAILSKIFGTMADGGPVIISYDSDLHKEIISSLRVDTVEVSAKEGDFNNVPYFDVEKQSWRSFKGASLSHIVEDKI